MPPARQETRYDVFISYRRGSADELALLLQRELERHGLAAFLDRDLRRGVFDDKLLEHIAGAPTFLIILTPGALDRCSDEDDWLRKEIVHAIGSGRNVVPLRVDPFQFTPELIRDLDPAIRELSRYQAVDYSRPYFESTIEKIVRIVEEDKAERKDLEERWRAAENTSIASDETERTLDLRSQINGLIAEGTRINNQCQSIPTPHEVPIETKPEIANSIVNWQQRAEAVLSLDVDQRPLQMWNKMVVSTTPGQASNVGFYCAVLNSKIGVLNRIMKCKNTTPKQLMGQLSSLITEGDSLRQSCVDTKDVNEIQTREFSWLSRVHIWLDDNFDEEHFQAFNHAPLNTEMNMPGDRPSEIASIWKRTKERIDVLSGFSKEFSN